MQGWILLIGGVGIGLIASMLGIGGGVFMVPLLNLGIGYDIHEAIGMSLLAIVFTSASSSFAYYRERRIDFLLAGLLASTAIVGAYFGAVTNTYLSSPLLSAIFGAFLVYPATKMMRGKKEYNGKETSHDTKLLSILLLGFGSGFASTLLGIGAGSLMVPAMFFLGTPMHIAIATSLFTMAFIASFGSYVHFSLGNIDFIGVLPLIAGVLIGAQLGSRVALRVRSKRLGQIFGILLLCASIRMIWGLI